MLAGNAFGAASNALVGDAEKLFNDTAKSALFLVNQTQPTPTNQPAPAAVLNQWNLMQSELAADLSKTWQAFVQYEFAFLQAYQQTIAQTYATLLADVNGFLTGNSSSPSPPASPTAASGGIGNGQGSGANPTGGGIQPPVSGARDPLYVLDLDTGETIPANATLNTFSTWSEDLLAQVSGGAVSSYSWNVSGAPDLTNVSGQNTANLQGTWANFTGTARTDTISVTETPQSGQPLALTMTFIVAGTNSPALSSSRPTSSSTWPTVITPDQLSSGQATQSAGPYANIGLADGSVQTSFAMPSYNPNTTPVSLDYNSTTANPQPIFLDEYQLPMGQTVPSSITAQLTFNGTALSTVTYNTSGLNAGDIVQIALQANATGLTTGRYPWSITVTNGTNQTTSSGNVDIVNQANSPFGAGWSQDNVEQLVSVTGGMMLVNPDGTSLFFASNGQGGYSTPAGDFSTLSVNMSLPPGAPATASLGSGNFTRTMPDGTKINFNASGQETSSVDRDGNTTSFAYNSSGQVTSITDMNNQVTTLAYNSSGLLSSITDQANRRATLTYTGSQLTSITDPANDVWQYGYDASNDLTALTDPNNHTTTFNYNSADRFSSATLADNSTEKLTAMQMNGWAAAGGSTNAVLLATGDQALFTDGNSNVWTTGLDWLGFGSSVLNADPLGDTSLTYRDPNDLPWLSSDPLAHRTREFFNSQGNPTEIVNPEDNYSQYQYNGFSEVTRYTDPTGAVSTYTYNSKGDMTQMEDARLHTWTYTYNSQGFRTSAEDPLLNTTSYGYNTLNELTTITNALSQTTTYGYDADGNRTTVTDPLDHTTTTTYDAQDRVLTVTDPLSGTTTYTYDLAGNEKSITDPDKNTTTYTYDAVNRLSSTINPMGYTATYDYNAGGEMTSMTDADGRTTTYSYDAAGRRTGETWVGGGYTATWTYDAAGNVSVAEDTNSEYSYGYDAANRLTSVNNSGTPGVPQVTLSYSYDDYNDLTGLTDSLGGSISYTYDADHNMTGQSLSLNGTTEAQLTMAYDAANRLTGQTRTSVAGSDTLTSSYSYDNANELTAINYQDVTKSATLANYTYSYTKGQLTGYQHNSGNSLTYGYDANGELTSATGTLDSSNYSVSYSYDANGNRNMTGYTAGAGNELTSDGTYNYTYDQVGNMTSQTNISTGYVTYYSWDYRNRLIEVKQEDNHNNVLNDEKFTYDVNNNRIAVSLNGMLQLYTMYDGANPYMDFNGNGTLIQRYLLNPKALSQFFGQVNASGTVQWFLTDNINSIRQVISASGSVLDVIIYDPYGIILNQTNAANAPRLMYAGGAVDSITGNEQFDRRYYNPADGRWLSQDHLGFSAHDTDLYRYTFNQPNSLRDPGGEFIDRIVLGGIIATGGFLITGIGSAIYGISDVFGDEGGKSVGKVVMIGGVTIMAAGVLVMASGLRQVWPETPAGPEDPLGPFPRLWEPDPLGAEVPPPAPKPPGFPRLLPPE